MVAEFKSDIEQWTMFVDSSILCKYEMLLICWAHPPPTLAAGTEAAIVKIGSYQPRAARTSTTTALKV